GAQGCRCVRGAERELLEDLVLHLATLPDRVEPTILAVDEDRAVRVDRGGVHAPLEGVRMVGHAADGSARVSAAALGVVRSELPLDLQIWGELRDEVSLGVIRRILVPIGWTVGLAEAVRTGVGVVVLLGDDGVRAVMQVDAGGRVPSELIPVEV